MANKLPNFISEFLPYSRIVKRKNGFRQTVSSYMERSKILIGDAYDVDYDRVVDIFLREWDKSEKDYPSPSIISPQNISEFDLFNQYALYLWEYYVENASKEPPKPKAPPKVPVAKKLKIEKAEPEPPQVTTEGEFEGYGDDDDMITVEGAVERAVKRTEERLAKANSALTISEKLYEGVGEEDLVGEDVDERILRILGLDDAIDIDYGTYQSLLKEQVIKSTLGKSNIARDEEMLLAEEFKRIKGKVGRFKVNKKRIRTATAPAIKAKNFITGQPEAPQKLLPPATPEKRKRKATLAENVAAIRKTCDAILKLMEGQYSAIRKQLQKERREKENTRRANRENLLEAGVKKTMAVARRMLTPVFDLLGRIIDFIGKILLGRILIKLVDWLANEENQKKIQSLIKFIGDWWPALLAGYLLFFNPIGRLVRTVMGTIAKLTFTIAKKGIPKLLKLIAANPLKSAAILIPTLAAAGAIQQANTPAADPKEAAEGKTQLNDTLEMGGVTGDPMSVLGGRYSGGGQVAGYSGGGTLPKKRTMPNGGKVKNSTGKRVRGAGKDTQMIVAQPGEVVISKKAVDKFGAPFFLNLNKAGGGTNKPSWAPFGNIMMAQGGGLVKQPEGGVHLELKVGEKTGNGRHVALTEPMSRYPGGPRYQMVSSDIGSGQERRWLDNPYDPKFKKDGKTLEQRLSEPPSSGMLWGDGPMDKPKAKTQKKPTSAPSIKMRPEPLFGGGGQEREMEQPNTKPAAPQTSAVFTGVLPKSDSEPKPQATTATVAPSPSMTAPPPPPQPSVNVTAMTQKLPRPKATGSTGSGTREIPSFEAFYQNEERIANIEMYGLVGVE